MKPHIYTDKHRCKKRFINKKSVFICVSLWLIIFAFDFQSQAQTYTNPVIPGDFPDPSVIRVGSDYYATATTGDWSPNFPILHSTDLVNWKIVGAVFYQKPQWAKGDFWAPEITADKGRYFVYYSARRDEGKGKKGTLCVAVAVAEKPEGPYLDKGTLICQEMGSIDADFIRDETGKPYLIWKEDGNDRQQPTWIYAQELDESGTRVLGGPHRLFRNTEAWEGGVIEGAYILRRDGWFYLFYSGNACCGESCNYALGVARSKTLLGNWEKNPANPILAANDVWQCPGHGSIVETPDDRSFLLYHAYRKSPLGFQIGREALLDEVKFADGWATINGGKGASNAATNPFANIIQQSIFADLSDEFNDRKLSARWSHFFSDSDTARISDGYLTIKPTQNQLAKENPPEIFISERMVSGNYTARTKIIFGKLQPDETVGIAAYSWRKNSVGIGVGSGSIFTWKEEKGNRNKVSSENLPKNFKVVQLKIKTENAAAYDFYYSLDEGKNWKKLGETIDGSFVEDGRAALVYRGSVPDANAKFDWLRIEPN